MFFSVVTKTLNFHKKKQYLGENCLKRQVWTVWRFKGGDGGLGKIGGAFEERVDTPMHTMSSRSFWQLKP